MAVLHYLVGRLIIDSYKYLYVQSLAYASLLKYMGRSSMAPSRSIDYQGGVQFFINIEFAKNTLHQDQQGQQELMTAFKQRV